MAAEIIVLAEWREARLRYAVTFDPLVLARSWWDWMAGLR